MTSKRTGVRWGMPKRGEKLPWRMRYCWEDTKLSGMQVFRTEEDAQTAARRQQEYADQINRVCTTTVTKRKERASGPL